MRFEFFQIHLQLKATQLFLYLWNVERSNLFRGNLPCANAIPPRVKDGMVTNSSLFGRLFMHTQTNTHTHTPKHPNTHTPKHTYTYPNIHTLKQIVSRPSLCHMARILRGSPYCIQSRNFWSRRHLPAFSLARGMFEQMEEDMRYAY